MTAIPSQVVKLIDMTGGFSACLVQTRQSESDDKDLHAPGHRAAETGSPNLSSALLPTLLPLSEEVDSGLQCHFQPEDVGSTARET